MPQRPLSSEDFITVIAILENDTLSQQQISQIYNVSQGVIGPVTAKRQDSFLIISDRQDMT